MMKLDFEKCEEWRDPLPVWVDLSAAVEAETLLSWIETEVAMLSWNMTEQYERSPAKHGVVIELRRLLHLLSFSYATGLYGSEEIIRACRTDPLMRDICGGMVPFAHELQSARRRHRMLLEKVLAAVMLRVALARPGVSGIYVARNVSAGATQRLNAARHLDSSLD